MPKDISRHRKNPLRDYAAVELKQGAVLLDADWNEAELIGDRRLRALASDVLGRGTVAQTTPDAFRITSDQGALKIGIGRLYVDGLLAENHGAPARTGERQSFDDLLAEPVFPNSMDYFEQPYLPGAPQLPTAGNRLVYLDVWQREVTHLEHTDLVDIAVGVETSSRLQTVWQVRVLEDTLDAGVDCGTPDADLPGWSALIAPSTGVLTTDTAEVDATEDPCELPPTGGFRGLENQTYRVEVHDPGQAGGTATFKWSRENASVGSRVSSISSPRLLELDTLGRDDVLSIRANDWVEIIDERRELSRRPGAMLRVISAESRTIELAGDLPPDLLPLTAAFPDSDFPRAQHLRVRRWDQRDQVLPVPPAGTKLLLENGITVEFDSTGGPTGKGFQTGDHWVFAARTANSWVEPLDRAPPLGIHHHYARLAIWTVKGGGITDCRVRWPPAGGNDCACSACVTPASHESGQFTIQNAVNQVRTSGGDICLAPGRYVLDEPVRLIGAQSLAIRGQGYASTRLHEQPPVAAAVVLAGSAGLFLLEDCTGVIIENLQLASSGETAFHARDTRGLELEHVVTSFTPGTAGNLIALAFHGLVEGVRIANNRIQEASIGVSVGSSESEATIRSLTIEGSRLSCSSVGISLEKVQANGTVTITGNTIEGCSDAGIITQGSASPDVPKPGQIVRISDNQIRCEGSGIRATGFGGGFAIERNVISAPGPRLTTSNHGLFISDSSTGQASLRIAQNRVSGFLLGMAVWKLSSDESQTLAELQISIEDNLIHECFAGIYTIDHAFRLHYSIRNNHILRMGLSGILVAGGRSATIAGNSIRELARDDLGGNRTGITGFSYMLSVCDNELTDIGPRAAFDGEVTGIRIAATDFDVSNNHVMRDLIPASDGPVGIWAALSVTDLTGFRISDLTRPLGTALAVPDVPADVGLTQSIQRGLVLGNTFQGRAAGTLPAVVILMPDGHCTLASNRVDVERDWPDPGRQVEVLLQAGVAIVSGNHVTGSQHNAMANIGVKAPVDRIAVLGNVTRYRIKAGLELLDLEPPWVTHNLHLS